MERNTIVCTDALSYLKTLPDESVNCCVSSPPYMNLRSYMDDDEREIGKEPTVKDYVGSLVTIFRELRRVLRRDGVFWLNVGDAFANDAKWGGSTGGKHVNGLHGNTGVGRSKKQTGFKPKDLMLIPSRLAIALQDDGWTVRQDCIWWKRNVMPSSQRDRPTTDYEHVFMLTRSPHYWYDDVAVAEPSSGVGGGGWSKNTAKAQVNHGGDHYDRPPDNGVRTRRAVWDIPTEPSTIPHYAMFPTKLVEICLLAGFPETVCAVCGKPYVRVTERIVDEDAYNAVEGQRQAQRMKGVKTGGTQRVTLGKTDKVQHSDLGFAPTCECGGGTARGIALDPFMGTGTTALVARRLNRDYIGCELNPKTVALANERLRLPFEEHYVEPEAPDFESLPFFIEGDSDGA